MLQANVRYAPCLRLAVDPDVMLGKSLFGDLESAGAAAAYLRSTACADLPKRPFEPMRFGDMQRSGRISAESGSYAATDSGWDFLPPGRISPEMRDLDRLESRIA